MADKFQNKYRIPSARAVWHDYNGGDYFITICTGDRVHYFGEIVNGQMMLNGLGTKLNELIAEIPTHHSYAKTPVYQIMPNHVHLIVCIDGTGVDNTDAVRGDVVCGDAVCRDAACHVSTTKTTKTTKRTDAACHVSTTNNKKMQEIANQCGLVSIAMGGLKSALTKYANANSIKFEWQTRFHDHIIRDEEEWERIANYIVNNPSTWENDKFFTK